MRLNKFIATASGLSRREADDLIKAGRVEVNSTAAILGQPVVATDIVRLDGQTLKPAEKVYLALNKPTGYVCSRRGQGASTIYELLPQEYQSLKSVGRLDKDTSGLILLSNDGDWAHSLTHPKFRKTKTYEVQLERPLSETDKARLKDGVKLEDGQSRLNLSSTKSGDTNYVVSLHEGRNRQIRRTFSAIDHQIVKLHRTQFGPYSLNKLKSGQYKEIENE